MRTYYVYIVTNLHRTLYVGVTNHLERRVMEHKQGLVEGFTKQYGLVNLVYYEEHRTAADAIFREKQLKGWLRAKKVTLIESVNPKWRDLAESWYAGITDSSLRSE